MGDLKSSFWCLTVINTAYYGPYITATDSISIEKDGSYFLYIFFGRLYDGNSVTRILSRSIEFQQLADVYSSADYVKFFQQPLTVQFVKSDYLIIIEGEYLTCSK